MQLTAPIVIVVLLYLQVKAIFGTGKKKVAGCYVESGKLSKGAMIEVVRGSGKDKSVVYTGKLASLRRIKDTVDEVGRVSLLVTIPLFLISRRG